MAPHQKFTAEGKKKIQERITLISTILSGCARDTYMLMTQGQTPTLPTFLKNNPMILKSLLGEENKELCAFMLNEYKSMNELLDKADCPSHLLTKEEVKQLAIEAKKASGELQSLTHKSLEA